VTDHPAPAVAVVAFCLATALLFSTNKLRAADSQPVEDAGSADITFSTGFDYTKGSYGTPRATRLLYIPFTLLYDADAYSADVTMPYLYQSGPTGQTVVGGRVVPSGATVSGRAAPRIATVHGWGDLVLGGTRYFEGASETSPAYSLRAQVKFGTAKHDVGLGTGKNDYTFSGAVSKFLDQHWGLSGDLGHTKFGSPSGIRLKPVIFASIGAAYRFADKSRIGLAAYAGGSSFSGTPAPVDVTAYYSFAPSKSVQLRAYLLKGLSQGSPNHGFGLSASFFQ
jgi:hypothetical protein